MNDIYRNLLGEDLGSLGIKDLEQLEKQLDSSLRHIRSTRVIHCFPNGHNAEAKRIISLHYLHKKYRLFGSFFMSSCSFGLFLFLSSVVTPC